MNYDPRVLRGLTYATLIFSLLGVLIGIAFVALMVNASSMLSDPTVWDAFMAELQSDSPSAAFDGETAANTYDFSQMSEEDIAAAAGIGMQVVIALAVGYLILRAVGLVSSIVTLRALANPEKLGSAFVWTIIAAICALLSASFVSCICFALAAWFNSSFRKMLASYGNGGIPHGGVPQGGAPQGGIPQGGMSGSGYQDHGQGTVPPAQQMPQQQNQLQQPGQPQQPVQPQQQNQPQQPIPPQQPGQPQQLGAPSEPSQQPGQLQQSGIPQQPVTPQGQQQPGTPQQPVSAPNTEGTVNPENSEQDKEQGSPKSNQS